MSREKLYPLGILHQQNKTLPGRKPLVYGGLLNHQMRLLTNLTLSGYNNETSYTVILGVSSLGSQMVVEIILSQVKMF